MQPKADNRMFCSEVVLSSAYELPDSVSSSILGALLTQATDCIAVKDLQGRYLLINQAGAEFLGFKATYIIGKTDFELFSKETAQKISDSDQEVMFSGKTQLVEELLNPLNGKNRHFQAMKCAYKSSTGEVLGVINVVRDVTEAKLAEMALKRSNQELEQFASVVSHDLQAPLRKIIFFASAIEEQIKQFPGEAQDYLGRIQKTAHKMNGLVVDILNLSRARRGKLKYTPIHLKALVEEAIQEVNTGDECLKGCFKLTGIDLTLEADSTQIRQLLINLFGNALKFQKPGNEPRILVDARLLATGECQIQIQDNGVGFDAKHSQQIFKAFERLHSTREFPGTGMGLAICERIVERHGGTITVESERGAGTTFYIQLPLTQN